MLSIITAVILTPVKITTTTKIDSPAMADPGHLAGIKIITPRRTIGPQAATIKLTTDRAALETGKARITEIIIARSVGATALVKNIPRETIIVPLATAEPLMTEAEALTNKTRPKMALQKQTLGRHLLTRLSLTKKDFVVHPDGEQLTPICAAVIIALEITTLTRKRDAGNAQKVTLTMSLSATLTMNLTQIYAKLADTNITITLQIVRKPTTFRPRLPKMTKEKTKQAFYSC